MKVFLEAIAEGYHSQTLIHHCSEPISKGGTLFHNIFYPVKHSDDGERKNDARPLGARSMSQRQDKKKVDRYSRCHSCYHKRVRLKGQVMKYTTCYQ